MAELFKQSEIAGYLASLQKEVKSLKEQVQKLEQQDTYTKRVSSDLYRSNPAFHAHQEFLLTEIFDDFILARAWDGSVAAGQEVAIIQAYPFIRAHFDNKTIVGREYTYYSPLHRLVKYTDTQIEDIEDVYPLPQLGVDVISAIYNPNLNYIIPQGAPGNYTDEALRISWQNTNSSARTWRSRSLGGSPGIIKKHVSGNKYKVTLFQNGITQYSTLEVDVTQLHINSNEIIPTNTYVFVFKVGEEYNMQVPIWI